jgi:hypothetical protein
MDEHAQLLDQAAAVRARLRGGELVDAQRLTARLVGTLRDHVQREERGIFTALRNEGEFVAEVDALEAEHVDLDARIAALDPESADYARRLSQLFDRLAEHVEREELGVFPVAIVTLGATG